MSAGQSFEQLIAGLRSGSEEAAVELMRSYLPTIRRAIRRRLSPKMKSKYGESDFAQSAFRVIYEHPSVLDEVEDTDHLSRLLAKIAVSRLIDACRREATAKRDIDRTHACESPGNLPGNDPTASQLAMDREVKRIIADLLPVRDVNVLRLRLGGATLDEIAERTGLTRDVVRGCLERQRDMLAPLLEAHV